MQFLYDGKVGDPDSFTYIGNQGTVNFEFLIEKKKHLSLMKSVLVTFSKEIGEYPCFIYVILSNAGLF